MSVISAHRNPDELIEHCNQVMTVAMREEGTLVFIGIAGMAAALPGTIAAITKGAWPVIGVALPSPNMPDAMDALLSMVRMPPGVPVICTGIGDAGLKNAALIAAQLTGMASVIIRNGLEDYLKEMATKRPVQIGIKTGNQ